MIEVEKKFQPTDEQLQKLIKDAVFVSEKTIHDLYYDFSDFRIFKAGCRLRKRDSGFELKQSVFTETSVVTAREYNDESEIKKVLKISDNLGSLEEITKNEMTILCDFTTLRRKYNKGEFGIDIDVMSFGESLTEIELLVKNEEEIREAENKILSLAADLGLEEKNLPLKPEMYLQKIRPEIYKQILGKEVPNEFRED